MTRCLGSVFLDHFKLTVFDQLKMFHEIVQISMDGPAVNWNFFDVIHKQVEKDFDNSLVNIGS